MRIIKGGLGDCYALEAQHNIRGSMFWRSATISIFSVRCVEYTVVKLLPYSSGAAVLFQIQLQRRFRPNRGFHVTR